jgi:hypothetical protein
MKLTEFHHQDAMCESYYCFHSFYNTRIKMRLIIKQTRMHKKHNMNRSVSEF